MKIDFDPFYGADRDGNRSVPMIDASLNDSPEERENIAESIYSAMFNYGEINLLEFEVNLSIDSSAFVQSGISEFTFTISPVEYMDLVIPKLLMANWLNDSFRMSCLWLLEWQLLELNYNGEELVNLTKVVNRFRGMVDV